MIGNLKTCFFSHGLDLTYDLADEALFQKFRSQVGIQGYGYVVVALGYIALGLSHLDQQIIFGQHYQFAAEIKLQCPICLQGVHSGIAVDLRQSLADVAKLLAVLRSDGLKLRLEKIYWMICIIGLL